MSPAAYSRIDRLVAVVTALWALACIGLVVFHFVRNPMDARRDKLDNRLALIFYMDEPSAAARELDYRQLHDRIVQKEALWQDLVAPPPPPKVVEKGPDLDELVKGIRASAREELKTAQGVRVKIRTQENSNGAWRGVGDTVNGLVIKEITADEVVFKATIKKKDYEIPVKRK